MVPAKHPFIGAHQAPYLLVENNVQEKRKFHQRDIRKGLRIKITSTLMPYKIMFWLA